MHVLIATEHSGQIAALDALATAAAATGHRVTLTRLGATRRGVQDEGAPAEALQDAHARIGVAAAPPRDAGVARRMRGRLLALMGRRDVPDRALIDWLDEVAADAVVVPAVRPGPLGELARAAGALGVPVAVAPLAWSEFGTATRATRLLLAWNAEQAAASRLPDDRVAVTGAVAFDRLLVPPPDGTARLPAGLDRQQPYAALVTDAGALRDIDRIHTQLRRLEEPQIVVCGHDVAKNKALLSAPRLPADLENRVAWATYEKADSPATMRAAYLAVVGGAARVASSLPEALLDAALLDRPVLPLDPDRRLAALVEGGRTRVEPVLRPHSAEPAAPAAVAALERLAGEADARSARRARARRPRGAPTPPALPSFRSRVQAELELLRYELRALAAQAGPVVAGPFSTEVGFELLYWVPFLRWAQRDVPDLAGRLAVVSRGGTASWYRDVAGAYADLYEISSPVELMERRDTQKQRDVAPFELELVARARTRLGLADGPVLHPSVFFRFYYRMMKIDQRSFARTVDPDGTSGLAAAYAPIEPPPLDSIELPDDFIAVRFYSRPSFPATPENAAFVTATLERLAATAPVVLLNNELELDDHADFVAAGRVTSISQAMTPPTNLHVQTTVLARARAFVGTYGGLSYLAPALGVPAVAFSSLPEHTHPFHLDLAQRIFDSSLVVLRPAELDLMKLVVP